MRGTAEAADMAGFGRSADAPTAWFSLLAVVYGLVLGGICLAFVGEGQALQWDNGAHNLPLTWQAASQWFAGRLPAWNPFLWSGSPLLADPQAMAFYPPALIVHALTRSDPLQSMRLLFAIHVAIAATGTSLAGRAFGCSPIACFVAATTVALNPFAVVTGLSFANIYASYSWLPWQVVTFDRLVRADAPRRRLLPAAVAGALGWLAGYPAAWIFGAMFVVLLTLSRIPATLFWRRIGIIPIAYALGLALVSFQILPFLSLGFGSNRATPLPRIGTGLPLGDLPGILVPGLRTGLARIPSVNNLCHVGLLIVTTALLALRRPDRLRVTLALLAVCGIWTAMGPGEGLADVLFRLPVIRLLRKPELFFLLWAVPGLALLGALGLDDLLHHPRAGQRIALSIAVVLSIAIFFLHQAQPGRLPSSDLLRGAAALAVAVVTTLGVILGVRTPGARWAKAFALVGALSVLLIESSIYAVPAPRWRARYANPPNPRLWETLPTHEQPLPWRRSDGTRAYWGISILRGGRHPPDLGMAIASYWDVEMATGYSALIDPTYARAVDYHATGLRRGQLTTMAPRDRILDVLSTPYVFVRNDPDVLRFVASDRWVTARAVNDGTIVLARHRTLPRARAVLEVSRTETRAAAIRQLQKGVIRPEFMATVDGDDPASAAVVPGVRAACDGRILVGAPGRFVFDVSCPGPGFLVFSERALAGWRAEIDGKAAPLARAYGLVLGLDVPAGHSTVSLLYYPPGFDLGLAISGGVFLVLVALSWMTTSPGSVRTPPGPDAPYAERAFPPTSRLEG